MREDAPSLSPADPVPAVEDGAGRHGGTWMLLALGWLRPPPSQHQPLAAPCGFGHPRLYGKGPKWCLGEGELSSQGFSSYKSGQHLLVAMTAALAVPFDCLQMHISITQPLKSHLPRSIPAPLFLID